MDQLTACEIHDVAMRQAGLGALIAPGEIIVPSEVTVPDEPHQWPKLSDEELFRLKENWENRITIGKILESPTTPVVLASTLMFGMLVFALTRRA